MIDKKVFDELSVLSKFDFTPEQEEKFISDLNKIVEFVGRVKKADEEFGTVYDDTADNNAVCYDSLREDVARVTATPEQLLANTESERNCYVIPKVLD